VVICFDCSRELKTVFEALLEGGKYKEVGQILSAALEKRLVAYAGLRQTAKGASREESSVPAQPPTPSKASGRSRSRHAHRGVPPRTTLGSIEIPPLFRLEGLSRVTPEVADPPAEEVETGQAVPLNKWVFGQYNKLLPAKATCRALAHLLTETPSGVPLEKALRVIPEEAWLLGDTLAEYDHRFGSVRDDRLATAFPVSKQRGADSCARYASQFVASVNERGQLSGLPYALKFLNRVSGPNLPLRLTEAGWRFATLLNPVLDGPPQSPQGKFSEEEIRFLLEHVKQNVPPEDFAYRAISTAIRSAGEQATPRHLDTALAAYVPDDVRGKVSRAFLASQRSGAISRMVDLDLIRRKREAVHVFYQLTPRGTGYADQRPDVIEGLVPA